MFECHTQWNSKCQSTIFIYNHHRQDKGLWICRVVRCSLSSMSMLSYLLSIVYKWKNYTYSLCWLILQGSRDNPATHEVELTTAPSTDNPTHWGQQVHNFYCRTCHLWGYIPFIGLASWVCFSTHPFVGLLSKFFICREPSMLLPTTWKSVLAYSFSK